MVVRIYCDLNWYLRHLLFLVAHMHRSRCLWWPNSQFEESFYTGRLTNQLSGNEWISGRKFVSFHTEFYKFLTLCWKCKTPDKTHCGTKIDGFITSYLTDNSTVFIWTKMSLWHWFESIMGATHSSVDDDSFINFNSATHIESKGVTVQTALYFPKNRYFFFVFILEICIEIIESVSQWKIRQHSLATQTHLKWRNVPNQNSKFFSNDYLPNSKEKLLKAAFYLFCRDMKHRNHILCNRL